MLSGLILLGLFLALILQEVGTSAKRAARSALPEESRRLWVGFGSRRSPSRPTAPLKPVPPRVRLCDTQKVASLDPKSVKVNLSTGRGVDIEWTDGHGSHYSFAFLRDACPCALCNDERQKARREPGEPQAAAPGTLPIFKPAMKPTSAEGVGKYAIKFHWNDGHDLGIYSWKFLREVCPCQACKIVREAAQVEADG
jgi:DUF971 family protein